MQKLEQHQITKIITKLGATRDYYCEQHNTSYLTLESLREEHPKLVVSKINEFKKGEGASCMTVSPSQSNSKSTTNQEGKRRI